MVAIPEYIDPVIAEIDRLLEASQQGHTTKNIGFGEIGHECSRYLYLKIHAEEPEVFDAATLRIFRNGHKDESAVAADLRTIKGIELYTNDPDRENKQYKFDLLEGRLTGRLDGVIVGLIQAPKTPHLWENKSTSDKKFDALIKLKEKHQDDEKTLLEWNHKYYAQVQVGMLAADLDRTYMTVNSPGVRRITTLRIKLNKEYAKSLVEKAKNIIKAKEPPERIGGADWFQCRGCRFYSKCHDEVYK